MDSFVKALLHFNGADTSITLKDETGKIWTGAGNAQIDTAQSVFGGASLLLDGTGDYISTPDSADWDFGSGDFTIDFRIRFSSAPSGQRYLEQGTDDNNRWLLYQSASNVQLLTFVGGTNQINLAWSWTPSTNTWYHLAVTRNGSDWRCFIDGTAIGSTLTEADAMPNFAAVLNFGATWDHAAGTMPCWLDELRISKGIARWTANFTPPNGQYFAIKKIMGISRTAHQLSDDPLMSDATNKAYYKFESGAETTDSSGNSNTLTAIGTPTYSAGKFNQAVNLVTDKAFSITDASTLKPTGNWTISAWIKTSASGADFTIFQSQSRNTNRAGIWFNMQSTGVIYIESGKNTGTTNTVDFHTAVTTLAVNDGFWHLVTALWDGSYLKIYIDGKFSVQTAWANAAAYAATNYVRVGCYNLSGSNGGFFNGSIDDLCFFNGKALTDTEIYRLYNGNIKKLMGKTITGGNEIASMPLASDATNKAYYRFESGALTTDSSGNAHTLTAISDPAEVAGKFGGAVDLDGNDAYSATDHSDFKPTGNFSINLWLKNSTGTNMTFFQSYSQNTNVAGIWFRIGTNTVQAFVGNNTGTTGGTNYKTVTGTISVNNGAWRMITLTWDGSNYKIYVDTNLDVTVASTFGTAFAATNYVRIGCGNTTGTNIDFFNGSLDDVILFNGKALTATEISNIYNTQIKKYMGIYNV